MNAVSEMVRVCRSEIVNDGGCPKVLLTGKVGALDVQAVVEASGRVIYSGDDFDLYDGLRSQGVNPASGLGQHVIQMWGSYLNREYIA